VARINIDDSIYRDQRFINLCVKMGGLFPAMGALVCAWRLAQEWYLKPGEYIPRTEWNDRSLPFEIIDVGLAKVIGDRVRMEGIEKQFSWLKQRSDAGRVNKGKSRERSLNGTERARTSLLSSPYSSLPSTTHYSEKKDVGVEKLGLGKETGEVCKRWLEVLAEHGANRTSVTQAEELQLARGLQAHGREAVDLALLGAQYEPASETYKPSRHLSLKRVLDPMKFERFVNLGAQARQKQLQKKLTEDQVLRSLPEKIGVYKREEDE
jgi:hypothetical protein